MTTYRVPAAASRCEQTIKKSRFIAIADFAPDDAAVKTALTLAKSEFNDARHICHAAVLGKPATARYQFNDDGEPSGTAGRPILNVLQHNELGDILCLVVRYFGGEVLPFIRVFQCLVHVVDRTRTRNN